MGLKIAVAEVKLSKTRYFFYGFAIPFTASFHSNYRYPDQSQLRETILTLRAEGLSYRAITHAIGLHWNRIGQILKAAAAKPDNAT